MKLERLPTERGARLYKTHTGLKLPSVTTILGVIAKPALIPWAAQRERESVIAAVKRAYDDSTELGERPDAELFMELVAAEIEKEKAYRATLRKAAKIGTQVHERIEWEFLGELKRERSDDPPPLESAEAERSFGRASDWRKATKLKVIDTERMVASLHGQYAGTLDALVKVGGKVGILDFKTGKRVYEEAYLQSCAYRLALAEEGIKTQTGWIVLLPKSEGEEPFQVIETPPIAEMIAQWQAALSLYRWTREQKRKDNDGKTTQR